MHQSQEPVPVLGPREHRRPQRRTEPTGRPGGPWVAVAALAMAGGLAYSVYQAVTVPSRFGSAVVVAPLFLAVTFLAVRPLGRRERSFNLTAIAMAGAGLRLGLEVPRQVNARDGAVYHEFAKTLSPLFRSFVFNVDTQRQFPGTGFLRYLTGLVQVGTMDDRYATYAVFMTFSMAGAMLCYLAFARGVPDGYRQLYAALVFLWPSMAYWPSIIGKEAWMIMGIGLASYGTARVLTNRTMTGFAAIIAGLAATAMVRPHVSLIMLAAILVGVLVRKPQTVATDVRGRTVVRRIGGGAKVLAVILVLVGAGFLATQTQKILRIDDDSLDAIGAGLESTEAQTTQGGSAFTPFTVHNPADYPPALVTVLFRPFPNEAHSSDSLMSATEGLALLGLFVWSLPRLVHLPSIVRRDAYVAYALALVLVFGYAFSAIGNFGILARQRTQVLPMIFVLVCLPRKSSTAQDHLGTATDASTETDPRANPTETAGRVDRRTAQRRVQV